MFHRESDKGTLCLCLILFLTGEILAADNYRPQPALADVVLFCQLPLSSLNSAEYSDERRGCVEAYMSAAQPSFSKEPKTDSEEKAITLRRWRLERHAQAMIGPSGKTDAKRFAKDVPLCFEWEGMSDGPVSEAAYTERWLEHSPGSSIAPFLHLFAAYRYRAGFETAAREKREDQLSLARERYAFHLQVARTTGNEKIRCLVSDMETLPYVYLSGCGRP